MTDQSLPNDPNGIGSPFGDLPEGWAEASALELADLIRGVSYAKGEALTSPAPGHVALLRANNIGERLLFDDLQFIPATRVSDDQRLRVGDVVVAMSSGSKRVVGKAASVRKPWDGAFGAFCGVLRPQAEMNAEFFGLFFQTREYRTAISEAATGTNINNLKREYFTNLRVPVPPLTEQERIAAKVEALLARVNAARARLDKVPAILKRFRQSVLAAACSGVLTAEWRKSQVELEPAQALLGRVARERSNHKESTRSRVCLDEAPEEPSGLPDCWAWATLEQIRQGGRPIIYGIIKPGPHVPDGIPYVRVTEMKDGTIDVLSLRRTSKEKADKFRRATLAEGDLLISKDGTIGRVAIVPKELEGGNITQHLVRAAIHPFLRKEFISYAVRAPSSQKWLTGETLGVALQGVNVEDFRRLPLPIPPVQEQCEIVRRVEALFRMSDEIGRRVSVGTARAEKVTQAILAKAFRGELVPTEAELARREGRNYETASAMLERIRCEMRPVSAGRRV